MSAKELIHTYVTAQPGYLVIPFCEDFTEADAQHCSEAVIAWGIYADGFAVPVTVVRGVRDDDYGILLPDGRVQAYEASHPSVAEWLEDKKKWYVESRVLAAAHHAAKAARAAKHLSGEDLL